MPYNSSMTAWPSRSEWSPKMPPTRLQTHAKSCPSITLKSIINSYDCLQYLITRIMGWIREAPSLSKFRSWQSWDYGLVAVWGIGSRWDGQGVGHGWPDGGWSESLCWQHFWMQSLQGGIIYQHMCSSSQPEPTLQRPTIPARTQMVFHYLINSCIQQACSRIISLNTCKGLSFLCETFYIIFNGFLCYLISRISYLIWDVMRFYYFKYFLRAFYILCSPDNFGLCTVNIFNLNLLFIYKLKLITLTHFNLIIFINKITNKKMKNRLLYLILGGGLGAGGHYAYKQYNPERNVRHSSMQMIKAYIVKHDLEQGYIVNVLKSVGLMLKGFYHYGMDTKIQGFNYNATYIKKQQLKDQNKNIEHLYCIFSPTQFLCGHPQIQHGGATATIIDQNMGYLAILNSRQMVATGDLHIRYNRPIKRDQFYVLETMVTKRKGKKIYIKGYIKQLGTGYVKVESQAIFFTVNWDNQMSRILTTFFKAIDFKNYSEQNHQAANIHKMYQQLNLQTPRQSISQGRSFANVQKSSQQKVHEIQKLIHKFQEKEKLIQIPAAQVSKIYQEGRSQQNDKYNSTK